MLRRESTLKFLVEGANDVVSDTHIWGVGAAILLALLTVHSASYLVSGYWIFDVRADYPFVAHDTSDDNKLQATDTIPTASFDVAQFNLYIGFIMYATVVQTGLGLEYLVWRMFLVDDWGDNLENGWRISQFLFPIMVGTAVGLATTGNYLCFPILAFSLWKCGFPETIMFFHSSLYDSALAPAKRVANFVNGVGMAVHHSSSALYVAMIASHVMAPTPDLLSVCLPLLMQHWFVMLKYGYKWPYIVVVTVLEGYFEWTMFSVFERVWALHWIAGVLVPSMLFAHWCYYLAGILRLLLVREATHVRDDTLLTMKSSRSLTSARGSTRSLCSLDGAMKVRGNRSGFRKYCA